MRRPSSSRSPTRCKGETGARYGKVNLALVVGPTRPDGKHEVVTVCQRLDLSDRVAIEPAASLSVTGFAADTLVRRALETLAEAAGVQPRWAARITKRIPVAAGLGGGSSDAATALRLANGTLDPPLPPETLRLLAKGIGADVPFFLTAGPQLGRGEGADLEPLALPQDYWVVLLTPHELMKESTAAVYARFDERGGAARLRRAPCRPRALAGGGAPAARPRSAAPERPRSLSARGRAARPRCLSSGRDGRRPDRLRALPPPPFSRGGPPGSREPRAHLARRTGLVRLGPAQKLERGAWQAPHAPMRRPQSRRYVSSRRSLRPCLGARSRAMHRAQFLGRPIP